jgi:hypothetical protein
MAKKKTKSKQRNRRKSAKYRAKKKSRVLKKKGHAPHANRKK